MTILALIISVIALILSVTRIKIVDDTAQAYKVYKELAQIRERVGDNLEYVMLHHSGLHFRINALEAGVKRNSETLK